MLNDGFQYIEQRDSDDNITHAGVVSKKSPFATADNRGILDVISEDLRVLYDDMSSLSLAAMKKDIEDIFNKMKTDPTFASTTATAQAKLALQYAERAEKALASTQDERKAVDEASGHLQDAKSAIDALQNITNTLSKKVDETNASIGRAETIRDAAKASETNAAASAESAKKNADNTAAALDAAKKWAESDASPDGTADAKSSKGWASDAAASASKSQEIEAKVQSVVDNATETLKNSVDESIIERASEAARKSVGDEAKKAVENAVNESEAKMQIKYVAKEDVIDADGKTWNISARNDGDGNVISATYLKKADANFLALHGKADSAAIADSVDWSAIKNTPATYPPAAHNHDDSYVKLGDVSTDANAFGKIPKVSSSGSMEIGNAIGLHSTASDITGASVKFDGKSVAFDVPIAGNLSGNADSATKDSAGQKIDSTYIKGITSSGGIATILYGDGHTKTFSVGGGKLGLMVKEVICISRDFVVPDGVTKLFVSGCAGGGGGAMGIACGGGGGESCFRRVVNVTPGERIAVTIGIGGKGCQKGNEGSGTKQLNGNDAVRGFDGCGDSGTATVFGDHFTLKPGRGAIYAGNQTIYAGAAGGIGGTAGSPAGIMWPLGSTDGTGMFTGGNGGSSLFGIGGAGGSSWRGQLCCGGNAIGFGGGGGGGGAYCTSMTGNIVAKFMEGGSGSNGIIIVEWEV